jgi:hypothetical protein
MKNPEKLHKTKIENLVFNLIAFYTHKGQVIQ